jgi:Fe-S-cluster-containing hydrogenase component 2
MANLTMDSGAAAPSVAPAVSADYAEIMALPIMAGVPGPVVAKALADGGLVRREVDRDAILGRPGAGAAAPAIYVATGQVAAGLFEQATFDERWAQQERRARLSAEELEEESLLRPPPLAREAQKNVALFMTGDVFSAGAALQTPAGPVAFFTTAPSVILMFSQRLIADLAARIPAFEARFSRLLFASRERMSGVTGVKQEILDFFVRQGVSVAGEKVRVRQVGLCIDCKQCEQACEDRYGARRLTLGGYQLGMLDFIYTCRTCSDQRCVDPCDFDSIRFDAATREVVINEATCTGCTACAQACPYGAIDMVDVEDPRNPTYRAEFKARLDAKGALAFGSGTPRVARPRRIASKCDHCGAYGDQACVSACPTGSLIEVDPVALFRERSPKLAEAARAGFDADVASERREVLPIHPFTTDADPVRNAGLARVRRARWAPWLFWAVGIVGLLLGLLEILLRKYAPTSSYQFAEAKAHALKLGLPEASALEKIGFRAGDSLSVWAGVIGTGLMIIAAIYPVFRRVKVFRWLASNTMWFDFHLMAGIVGPLYVLLHTALKLDTWVSAAFWTMVIVVVSGFIGRYLYTQVPTMASGEELALLDNERALATIRAGYPTIAAEVDRELAEHRERAAEVARSPSVLRAMTWLVAEDLRRPFRNAARRRQFVRVGKQVGMDKRIAREAARRTASMVLIDRGQVVAPKTQLLLHAWKKVHVPFTVLLTVIAAAHIYLSWSRAW